MSFLFTLLTVFPFPIFPIFAGWVVWLCLLAVGERRSTGYFGTQHQYIENALKYTPEKGSVTVRTRTNGNALIFEVEDTGIGIEPNDLPRLFEKFYRGKQREARAQHGSGLGLAIVRSIAESHGGKVRVESKLGERSTFFMQIPLTQPKENRSLRRSFAVCNWTFRFCVKGFEKMAV